MVKIFWFLLSATVPSINSHPQANNNPLHFVFLVLTCSAHSFNSSISTVIQRITILLCPIFQATNRNSQLNMEALLSLSFDNLSSYDQAKIRKGLRQVEGLLAQICLSSSPKSAAERRHLLENRLVNWATTRRSGSSSSCRMALSGTSRSDWSIVWIDCWGSRTMVRMTC
jgi:hypothetical protein